MATCHNTNQVILAKTANGHRPYAATGNVQRFVLGDIPEVVDLHRRIFPANSVSADELQTHFREIFFENPWYDADLPSLVYREDGGRILGFYGVVPRPMRMKGRPIRVAVSSQFMVDPSIRNRLAAVELQRAFFAGPQDLSFTDGANNPSRRIWEGLGGVTAFPYTVHWTRPLRPAKYFLERWKERLLAPLRTALQPPCAVADILATRLSRSPFRQFEQPPEEDLNGEMLLEQLPKFSQTKSLCPDYDELSLGWLLGQAEKKKSQGRLRRAVVRNSGGQIAGWYLYYLNPLGICQVLQLVATKHSIRRVLDRLFYHAWRLGSFAVSGRLDPEFVPALSEAHCLFSFHGPQMLVYSKQPELLEAVQRGDAFLSRLEGEWWMRFQGG